MDGAFFAQASSTSTRLRKLPFGAHTYTVKARRDTSGNVSAASNTLTVTCPTRATERRRATPSGLTAVSLEDFCGSVMLSWAQSKSTRSELEYELYRNGVFFDLVTGTGLACVYAGAGPEHVARGGRRPVRRTAPRRRTRRP